MRWMLAIINSSILIFLEYKYHQTGTEIAFVGIKRIILQSLCRVAPENGIGVSFPERIPGRRVAEPLQF